MVSEARLNRRVSLLPKQFGVSDTMSYGLVFVISLVASVSSCIAVTGGLLVAVTAKYSEATSEQTPTQRMRPHLYSGTDIAMEAGNIVLVKGSPMKIAEALRLSRLTFRTIQQNLFWAFTYNMAAIPLAALGLLSPMIAAGTMALSSVSVVGNSLRIKRQKLQ